MVSGLAALFVDPEYNTTNRRCANLWPLLRKDHTYLARSGCLYQRANVTFTSGIGAKSSLHSSQYDEYPLSSFRYTTIFNNDFLKQSIKHPEQNVFEIILRELKIKLNSV